MVNSNAKLKIIGETRLKIGGNYILDGRRKSLGLISFLLLGPQASCSRESIAGLLWPESTNDRAKSSLRQELAEIRRAFGRDEKRYIEISRHSISLNRPEFSTDLFDLISDFETREDGNELTFPNLSPEGLFCGLDDLSVDISEWLYSVRAQICKYTVEKLQTLIEDGTRPIHERRRLIEIGLLMDPLNESVYRSGMEIAYSSGEIGEALSIYKKLYDLLDEELGMEPSDLTQDLIVKIKTGELAPAKTNYAEVSTTAENTNHEIPRIAVFPFTSLGPKPIPGYFLYGILDDTVCYLATWNEIHVISSNTTSTLGADHHVDDNTLTKLRADYFVVGSMQFDANLYRLTVQLINSKSKLVVWAKTYEFMEKELFSVQRNVAENIVQRIIPSLNFAELRRTQESLPQDLGAYHLMLRARELAFVLQRDQFNQAQDMLELSIEKDPLYSPAYSALADWYSISLGQSWSSDVEGDRKKMFSSLEKAVTLGQDNSRAIAMSGHNKVLYYRQYNDGLEMLENGLKLSPGDAETLMWSCPSLAFAGRSVEAVNNGRHAISLSPSDPYLFRFEHYLSIAEYSDGNVEEAAVLGEKSAQRNPTYLSNLRMTAASFAAIGQIERSREFADRALEIEPEFTVTKFHARQPFQIRAVADRLEKDLETAGLPV